jgi:hypothetical protein
VRSLTPMALGLQDHPSAEREATTTFRGVLGPPVQVAYVVNDPLVAARRFADRVGAGPFHVSPHIAVTDAMHRGRPTTFDHSSAYGQWGPLMVELVHQHDDVPSAIRDVYAPGEEGLHHVAHFVADLDAAVEWARVDCGWPTAMTAVAGGGTLPFAFVDARRDLGHMIELYEPTPMLRSFYKSVADAAVSWAGSPLTFAVASV